MKVYVVNHMLYSHSENNFQVYASEEKALLHYNALVEEEKKNLKKYEDTIKGCDAPEEEVFDNFRCYRTNCDDDIRVSFNVSTIDNDFDSKNPTRSMNHCW